MRKYYPILLVGVMVSIGFGKIHADAQSDQILLRTSWEAACRINDQKFSVHFHTDSPDPTEDDMTVSLRRPNLEKITLPIAKAWYLPRGLTANVESVCQDITALPVGDQRILLWLSVDDRPSWNQLMLVLLDLKTGQVLAQQSRVGPIKDCGCDSNERVLVIRQRGDVYDVRLEREWLQGTGNGGAGNSIEDWMTVTVKGDKIITAWH